MAASSVAGPSSGPQSSAPPLIDPLQTYAADHDSAEQALPESIVEMQSQRQVRNRHQQGQSGSISREHEGRSPELDTTSNAEPKDGDQNLEGKEVMEKGNIELWFAYITVKVFLRRGVAFSAVCQTLFLVRPPTQKKSSTLVTTMISNTRNVSVDA